MANILGPEWDMERDQPPYVWRRARLGRQAGARALGASLFELAPGASTFQLHAHHANEELIVVMAGRPTLVTPEGERDLEPGEVVAAPRGRAGAHRIDNRGEEPIRVLIASTMHAPDVNEFPETGELWVRDYAPGSDPPEEPLDVRFRPGA
jgi:uncharacterized cupin superfamily protein